MDKIIPIFHSLSKSMRGIHKASCDNISIVQSSILYEISLKKKPSMQTVAEAVGMDITTFSRQIGTLEKKELVTRTPYEGDRRIYLLSLTGKGSDMEVAINGIIAAKMENALASMNDFERETVLRSMHVLEVKLRGN
ncbi:MarR family winged helix-turn-helix transcriptional regulator [Sporosarcina sp. E16_8]|uniref:MarR family winged helix-turn-helix transcriptional regulator n=1 Tax=Sporosarcina sp. E16_8 TaxID=2789295 RepID=UPI001A92CB5D|nr:MarR family winged helix-turn-helix transcriptional regulator [Sporosarcina sp. E16_8]MBO0586836.1 winged helix-turn-helix transcriptional regulator [Sporosarcina sp. E16_8]